MDTLVACPAVPGTGIGSPTGVITTGGAGCATQEGQPTMRLGKEDKLKVLLGHFLVEVGPPSLNTVLVLSLVIVSFPEMLKVSRVSIRSL